MTKLAGITFSHNSTGIGNKMGCDSSIVAYYLDVIENVPGLGAGAGPHHINSRRDIIEAQVNLYSSHLTTMETKLKPL